jgi:ribosomal protein S18 acetylase RimI-like enzyme
VSRVDESVSLGTVKSSYAVRVLATEDWRLLRDLRRRALTEAPDAFFPASWTHEEKLDETDWCARLKRATWFVAEADRRAIGVICGSAELADSPDERHMTSLWTDPHWRGHGVARALIDAVSSWASDEAARTISLWVGTRNRPAISLYVHLGFETVRVQAFPDDPNGRSEQRMIRYITDTLPLIPGDG